MRKSWPARIFASVFLAPSAALLVLFNMPPLTECRSEAPIAEMQHWFRATQVVAQPWLGPHHVYGTFVIPQQYKRDRLYRAKLMIQGFATEFADITPEGEDIYSGQAELGHYIKRVYLPTRMALWLLLTGRFGDLKTPCHWRLVVADRIG